MCCVRFTLSFEYICNKNITQNPFHLSKRFTSSTHNSEQLMLKRLKWICSIFPVGSDWHTFILNIYRDFPFKIYYEIMSYSINFTWHNSLVSHQRKSKICIKSLSYYNILSCFSWMFHVLLVFQFNSIHFFFLYVLILLTTETKNGHEWFDFSKASAKEKAKIIICNSEFDRIFS